MRSLWCSLFASSFCAFLLFGCEGGRRPFLLVQMCLADEQDMNAFIKEVRLIAEAGGMTFIDGSERTEKSLKTLDYKGSERSNGSPVVNIGLRRKDGFSVGIGNLGLPDYQLAIGFSEGKGDPTEAREFAESVLQQVRKRWPVYVVPDGKGAMPLSNCAYTP